MYGTGGAWFRGLLWYYAVPVSLLFFASPVQFIDLVNGDPAWH